MNLEELKKHLKRGENLHTEFKLWPVHPDDLASSIIAFANTDGGQIILGVNDEGRVIGLDEDELDRIAQFVDNVAFNNCDPPVTVVQEVIRDEHDRVVLVVNVPKGNQRPYRTNRGIHYIRTASGRRQASREELLRLFQSVESIYYDEVPVISGSMDDLDKEAIEELLEKIEEEGFEVAGIPKVRLLRNWRLIKEVNGKIHPTLAGLLLIGRSPQRFFPYAYISALRIPGRDISLEPKDQKRIEGRLVEMLHSTMKFLDLYLVRAHRIQGLEPEVKPEFPLEALREGLVNAMAHRDYTVSAPIRVILYDDRIEFRTPGQLPNTVTIESLRFGVHVLRNPTIYNMFLKIGLVTDAGSGIPRMIRLLREHTGYEPQFRMEGNEFVVIFPRSQGP